MADIHDKETRSYNMSMIKGKDFSELGMSDDHFNYGGNKLNRNNYFDTVK
jgi:G:T-mismatch repair DNA endonuclease (very short patch repair protein)